MFEKVVVMDRGGQSGYILNHIMDNATFTRTYQKNSQLQLDFTIFDDGSPAAQLITNENYLLFRGQTYVIISPNATRLPGSNTVQVSAIHIGYRCDSFRVAKQDSAGGSMTPEQVLSHYFDGNDIGYQYLIKGNFQPQQVDSLSAGTGKTGLDMVSQTWPNAIVYPDGKTWLVYDSDTWFNYVYKQFTFGKNVTEMDSQPSSADTIVNIIDCYGSPAQNNDESGDSSSATQYANYVRYVDNDSVAKWGPHPQSDSLVVDSSVTDDQLLTMAKAAAHPDPQLSMTFNYDGDESIRESEIWHVNDPKNGYQGDAKITGLVEYPNDPSQSTQITIDDTQETMLDFDISMQRDTQIALARSNEAQKNAIQNQAGSQLQTIDGGVSDVQYIPADS